MVLSTETSALESLFSGQFKFLSLSLLAGMVVLIRSAPTIYTTFIIKCDKCYRRVWQVLSKSVTSVITKRDKCYHKVRQFYYNGKSKRILNTFTWWKGVRKCYDYIKVHENSLSIAMEYLCSNNKPNALCRNKETESNIDSAEYFKFNAFSSSWP